MADSVGSLPLNGIKVLELSHLIAGPYCCQLLAEEGANVIKVEPPGGEVARSREPLRGNGPDTVSAFFGALNRGKRSIVLNLKSGAGREVFEKLLLDADVFVTNMRARALDRLGIHPDSLREKYPRLIVAHISGFGLRNAGDYADRPGLAMVGEALSGTTGLTRDHEGNPVWCGFALGDIASAMTAHAAILLALRQQERFGVGRLIDLTLPECLLPMVAVALARIQVADMELSKFAGSNNFHGVPYGAFKARDGYVNLGVNSDGLWQRFTRAIGRPELADDPRYATYLERAKRQAELHALTEEFTTAHTRDELTEVFLAADVPMASILNLTEVLSQPYFKERGAFREVDDGIGGRLMLPIDPARFDTRTNPPAVPRVGQHRDEVLKEHGLADEAPRLEREGAFGVPTAEVA